MSIAANGSDDEVPRLRVITAAEVDGLAELKEPVEAQAREQAREILEDIKVGRWASVRMGVFVLVGVGGCLAEAAAAAWLRLSNPSNPRGITNRPIPSHPIPSHPIPCRPTAWTPS